MLQERQHFEAWKLEMYNKNLALESQSQVQAPPFIGSSGPSDLNGASVDVVNNQGDQLVLREVDLMT